MNWRHLYFGHVSPSEVAEAIKDDTWQAVRRSMKGVSLEDKYRILSTYYSNAFQHIISTETHEHDVRMLKVRCTNYVTALSRGGLIKPQDYRE